jgi:dextranase
MTVGDEPGTGDKNRIAGLRSFYRTGEPVLVPGLPGSTTRVLARRAQGDVFEAKLKEARPTASFADGLGPGTYSVEAFDSAGKVVTEELTTVGAHAGERPVHGFATSFLEPDLPEVLDWLRALRCTVVQVYDWMERYSAPLGPTGGWAYAFGRTVSFSALCSLANGIRREGAVAHAYAPVYAVDPPFAAAHPDWLLYRSDGAAERLFEGILLADPGNAEWQHHFVKVYGDAADRIGFNGFHLDTYGFPRAATNRDGRAVEMRSAYCSLLRSLRSARRTDLISFNQVNGVPSGLTLPGEPSFRYCEIWPPNERWRHFEGLLDRSSGAAGHLGASNGGSLLRGTIACYPPVWKGSDDDAREDCLRTVLLTEAVATSLGASLLVYGDMHAALRDPYYPKHERLSAREAGTALAWHRFALVCRDLFLEGEDTTWYDIGDENGAVRVSWAEGQVRAEPLGGCVFARVVRGDNYVAVSLIDLSGSPNGSWSDPTKRGRCHFVQVTALLADPEQWQTDIAVLGGDGGKFVPASSSVVQHREGLAAEVRVPLETGWSVLRIRRRRARTSDRS